jgi:hypothetical protein
MYKVLLFVFDFKTGANWWVPNNPFIFIPVYQIPQTSVTRTHTFPG